MAIPDKHDTGPRVEKVAVEVAYTQQPVFLLVHGTWSSPRTWASIRRTLRDQYNVASDRIKDFPWSGTNTPGARAQAAADLAVKIESLNDERVILIGHSHGGTVAALSIKSLKCPERVSGIIALSTPFPTVLRRNLETGALLASLVLSSSAVAFSALLLLIFAIKMVPETVAALLWLVGIAVAIGAVASLTEWLTPRLFAVLINWEDHILAQHTFGRSNVPLLCIAAKGDEAAGYLSFTGSVLGLPFLVLRPLGILFMSMLTIFPLALLHVLRTFQGDLRTRPDEAWPIFFGNTVITCFLSVALLPFVMAAYISMFSFVAWGCSLIRGSAIGFGFSGAVGQLLVRLTVTPTPLGNFPCKFVEIHVPSKLRHTGIHKLESIAKVVAASRYQNLLDIELPTEPNEMTASMQALLETAWRWSKVWSLIFIVTIIALDGINILSKREIRESVSEAMTSDRSLRIPLSEGWYRVERTSLFAKYFQLPVSPLYCPSNGTPEVQLESFVLKPGSGAMSIIELIDKRDLFKPLQRTNFPVRVGDLTWLIYQRNANRDELLSSAAIARETCGYSLTVRYKWDKESYRFAMKLLDELISHCVFGAGSKSFPPTAVSN